MFNDTKLDSEESERLFFELERLRSTLAAIEEEEKILIGDPEMQGLTLSLLTGQYLLDANNQIIKTLQNQLVAKAKEIRARREGYYAEHARLSKELMALTTPVIHGYIEEVSDLGLRPKLFREILEKKYDGRREKTILNITSNEKAISRIHQLIREGIKKIQSMGLSRISEIRGEFIRLKGEIEAVDWHITERIDGVDEADYFKFSFPQGVAPGYTGPLSGAR